MTEAAASSSAPRSIFARFLRFGLFAWGGPVAQIAMLRHELVDQERWVTSERFNRLLAVYVGSSRVDLQACKLEYSIVSPK